MRGIASRAQRCPKALESRRRGRGGEPPEGVGKPWRCPASPAASLLPGGSPGRSLWVNIKDLWYYLENVGLFRRPQFEITNSVCVFENREREGLVSANGGGCSGYHQAKSHEIDEELACVGPGTPRGELMRRFWHPVAMTSRVGDLPLAVRRLGENLVLFRDKGAGSAWSTSTVHTATPRRNSASSASGAFGGSDMSTIKRPRMHAYRRIRTCDGAVPERDVGR